LIDFIGSSASKKPNQFEKPELKPFLNPKEAIRCNANALDIEKENIRYLIQELHLQSAYTTNADRVIELADKLIKIRPKVRFFYKMGIPAGREAPNINTDFNRIVSQKA
jgi:hypothetical protein